jgi:hypothetical protein
MSGGRHIAESNAGIKFSTAGAMLDHNGRYHDQRVSSEWYISGVKIMDWPDGNKYHVAQLETVERKPFLYHYSHDGWHLPEGESITGGRVRCYVPRIGDYIYADRKSAMIHVPRDPKDVKPGSLWVGLKNNQYYFAGLDDATDLRIRKGRYQPDPSKRNTYPQRGRQ